MSEAFESKPTTFDLEAEGQSAPEATTNASRTFELDFDLAPAPSAPVENEGWTLAPNTSEQTSSTEPESKSAEAEHVFDLEGAEAPSDGSFVLRPVGATLSPREEAEESFAAARYDEARGLFQKLHRDHPNDPEILSRLVEITRKQEDIEGETLYQGLLGDAWIQDGDLERASTCFEQVLLLDPENSTAKRRVARFRELGVLSEQSMKPREAAAPTHEGEAEIPPGVLGLGNSLVSVRNESTSDAEKEEWLDLEGLLEEFKAGLKNHMDASDFQGHYDLALSHHQMGLLEEALEELDRVFACPELPAAVAQPARELRGLCLTGLQRGREAVHEFREAFDQAPEGNGRRTSLYHLAKALEAVEEWQEASEKFELLLSEAPGFLDANERQKRCQAMAAQSAAQSAEHRPAA